MFLKSGLFLKIVDLTSVHTEHLASLVACVTWHLDIRNGGEVSLDIMALTQYNGQGMCSNVDCCYETARRNKEEVRSWAKRMNWRVAADMRDQIPRLPKTVVIRKKIPKMRFQFFLHLLYVYLSEQLSLKSKPSGF